MQSLTINYGFKKIWHRNFLQFKKTWLHSAFWIVIEPVVYLAAIGWGLGTYVTNINNQSYLEFYLPGLLAMTSMFVAFFEGTYNNFTKLTHSKIYSTFLLSKISPDEIYYGEILWVATKSFISVISVSIFAFIFDILDTVRIFPALLILFIISLLFASLSMIAMSLAKDYESFVYSISGFIIPMSLIAGTYFPVTALHGFFQVIAYLLPLTHGVSAVRLVLAADWSYILAINILVLVMMLLTAHHFSKKLFIKKLIK